MPTDLTDQPTTDSRTPLDLGPIVITGGASGLGTAVAQAVQSAGGTPLVLDLDPGLGGFAGLPVDLADPRAAEAAVAKLAEEHGPLGGIVTAAGTDACGRIEDVPAEQWDRVVQVNLIGTAAVVRAATPHLEGGRIVTVASTLGYRALSDASAYCASKFGVVGMSRALQVELAGRIGVTLLIPGGMQTAFFDDRDPQYKPGPDAALQDPADVASAVLFALTRPRGSEVREMVVTVPTEPSWP